MTPIEHIRTKVLKLTQAEMATLAGVSQATVSRWESGRLAVDSGAMARIRDRGMTEDGWSDSMFFTLPVTAADAEIAA